MKYLLMSTKALIGEKLVIAKTLVRKSESGLMVQDCNPCCSEDEAGSWEVKGSMETEIGEKKTGDIVQQQVLA